MFATNLLSKLVAMDMKVYSEFVGMYDFLVLDLAPSTSLLIELASI